MKKHCDDLGFSYPNIFLSLFENTKLFVNCNFLRYSYDTVIVIDTVVELSSKKYLNLLSTEALMGMVVEFYSEAGEIQYFFSTQ